MHTRGAYRLCAWMEMAPPCPGSLSLGPSELQVVTFIVYSHTVLSCHPWCLLALRLLASCPTTCGVCLHCVSCIMSQTVSPHLLGCALGFSFNHPQITPPHFPPAPHPLNFPPPTCEVDPLAWCALSCTARLLQIPCFFSSSAASPRLPAPGFRSVPFLAWWALSCTARLSSVWCALTCDA